MRVMSGQRRGYPMRAYASSAEEARAQSDTLTASHRQITQVGTRVRAGEPGDTSGADAKLIWELGTLVASYAPSRIDGERSWRGGGRRHAALRHQLSQRMKGHSHE